MTAKKDCRLGSATLGGCFFICLVVFRLITLVLCQCLFWRKTKLLARQTGKGLIFAQAVFFFSFLFFLQFSCWPVQFFFLYDSPVFSFFRKCLFLPPFFSQSISHRLTRLLLAYDCFVKYYKLSVNIGTRKTQHPPPSPLERRTYTRLMKRRLKVGQQHEEDELISDTYIFSAM